MASNRSSGTKPELLVRALASALKLEAEWNDRKLPGSPDLALWAEQVAVFVHGCYWHSCPACYPGGREARGPNAELWLEKFRRNAERHAERAAELEAAGWEVLVLWECEVRRDLQGCAVRLLGACGVEVADSAAGE